MMSSKGLESFDDPRSMLAKGSSCTVVAAPPPTSFEVCRSTAAKGSFASTLFAPLVLFSIAAKGSVEAEESGGFVGGRETSGKLSCCSSSRFAEEEEVEGGTGLWDAKGEEVMLLLWELLEGGGSRRRSEWVLGFLLLSTLRVGLLFEDDPKSRSSSVFTGGFDGLGGASCC